MERHARADSILERPPKIVRQFDWKQHRSKDRIVAKKMIRPIRSEADYDAALKQFERCFEHEPKPGTLDADRFDLLALIVEDYERKRCPF
jgi:hypothetical protein